MLPPQWSLCKVVLRSPVGAKAERTQSEGRKEKKESTAHFLQFTLHHKKYPDGWQSYDYIENNVGRTDIIRIFAIGKRGNIMLIDSIESTKKDYFECERWKNTLIEKNAYLYKNFQ